MPLGVLHGLAMSQCHWEVFMSSGIPNTWHWKCLDNTLGCSMSWGVPSDNGNSQCHRKSTLSLGIPTDIRKSQFHAEFLYWGETAHTCKDFPDIGRLPVCGKTSRTLEDFLCMGKLPMYGRISPILEPIRGNVLTQ